MFLAIASPARADLVSTRRFRLYADFRTRIETDWDSQNQEGIPRDDRTRLRVRFRIGFQYEPDDHWMLEARLRSGQEESQQSPHVTILDFDGNDTGDASFNLDRWFLRGRWGGFWFWTGRNNLPFWRADELEYDDDVTAVGVALGWSRDLPVGSLALQGGYFSPPVGMLAFTGRMGGFQVLYRAELGGVRWVFAGLASAFQANPDDPDAAGLLTDNGFRDYLPLELSVEATWDVKERPLAIVADLLHNAERYRTDDPDPFTVENRDQTDGFAVGAFYGGLDRTGDWLIGYEYARIETLAVHNSYAEDDWVRWGTLTQIRASNMKGHELRGGYAFRENLNLLARLFLVQSITTVEDGKRFRIDFNYRF